jgi:hypothetical protein
MRAGALGFQVLESIAALPATEQRFETRMRVCKGYMQGGNLLHRTTLLEAGKTVAAYATRASFWRCRTFADGVIRLAPIPIHASDAYS